MCRWPKMLTVLSYAEKLIEAFNFEEEKWFVLTEKPGKHKFLKERRFYIPQFVRMSLYLFVCMTVCLSVCHKLRVF